MQSEASRNFSDQETPIDFVLVYNKEKFDIANSAKLETFVQNILDVGFKVEIEVSSVSKAEYLFKLKVENASPQKLVFLS